MWYENVDTYTIYRGIVRPSTAVPVQMFGERTSRKSRLSSVHRAGWLSPAPWHRGGCRNGRLALDKTTGTRRVDTWRSRRS